MNKKAFSLIELMVSLAIFAIIIGIPYTMFIKELKTTIRESSLSQSSIEQIPSLEILRKDIETAGYGLPWNVSGESYEEAVSSIPSLYSFNQDIFNDSPLGAPKAIVGKRDESGNGFSYLVLKSSVFGLNKAANHWTYIDKNDELNIWPNNNSANYHNLLSGDRAILINVGNRELEGDSLYFTVTKNSVSTDVSPSDYGFPSVLPRSVYLIYGIDTSDIRAPFNRIDYRLYQGGDINSECAKGTYTLAKAVMRQSDGVMQSFPILSCVADFQVVFGLDTTGNGSIDTWTQDLTLYNAKNIREELKQVRVYILVQNGVRDINYNYPYDNITVGETINGVSVGRTFVMNAITDYKHYRWRVVKIVVTPKNLE